MPFRIRRRGLDIQNMDAGIRFTSAPLLTSDFTLDKMNTTRAPFESVVASHDEHDYANVGSRR